MRRAGGVASQPLYRALSSASNTARLHIEFQAHLKVQESVKGPAHLLCTSGPTDRPTSDSGEQAPPDTLCLTAVLLVI